MSASKAKGTRLETAVCRYLTARGIEAKRAALSGRNDVGDIHIFGGRVVLECKSRSYFPRPAEMDKWQAETDREAARVAGCDVAALVVKRPGSGDSAAGDWFVSMRRDEFLWLATQTAWTAKPTRECVTINLAHFASLLLRLPAKASAVRPLT